MNRHIAIPTSQARRSRSGQSLIFLTLWLPVFFGVTALVVDMGYIYYCQSELTASTQAAALAGAAAMSLPGATVASTTAAVQTYSGTSGNLNAFSNLGGVTMMSDSPQFKCLSSLTTAFGLQCYGPNGSNALVVSQHVNKPVFFFQLFGGKTALLSATATAAMKGSSPGVYNVAIVVDSTASMNNTDHDSNCHSTRISCALAGVRILLQGLSPCQPSQSSCGTAVLGNVSNSVDRVSLYTFPAVSVLSAVNDSNCLGLPPLITSYAFPFPITSTYQIVGFSSDFRSSDHATSLDTSSSLVAASGGKGGCTGLQAIGGAGTYYAQVINTAQANLVAEQALFPGSTNVMIMLSDGDANSSNMPGASPTSGLFMSTKQQCHQAITAAQSAAAAGTRVYSVAYGATSSGCTTDTTPAITPCQTMEQIASSPQYFYSDYTATGGSSACVSASQPVSGLTQIFTSIVTDLSTVKLVPNGTT